MEALFLKIVLTPALVGLASLAGRKWGAEVSGWIVGIPFTSGPIAFFLAIGPGPRFAADASLGILAGTVSQAAFALAYARMSTGFGWPMSLAAATLAFAIATLVLNVVRLGPALTFAAAVATLLIALAFMPRPGRARASEEALPWWDIPMRMVVATVFVVGLTEAAPALGSRLAGLLAPFPLYASVLAVFANRLQGAAAVAAMLRGLLLGLFAFAGFFVTVAVLVVPQGIAIAFGVAIAVGLTVQALSLAASRRYPLAA